MSLAQQLGSFPSTLFVGNPGKETSPLWEFARKLLVEDADSTQDLLRPRIPYVSQKIAEHYLREFRDYLRKGDFLQKSIGIDSSLKQPPKRFAVAGRLNNATLVTQEEDGLFKWGHPFLTLTDVGEASINIPLWPTFSAMLIMWRPFQRALAVEPQNQFPRTKAALRYRSYLRDGLSRPPAIKNSASSKSAGNFLLSAAISTNELSLGTAVPLVQRKSLPKIPKSSSPFSKKLSRA